MGHDGQARGRRGWEFAAGFEESCQEDINKALVRVLGETHTTRAIRALRWTMNRDNLAELDVDTPGGVRGVRAGSRGYTSFFVQIVDGLWLEAALPGEEPLTPPGRRPGEAGFDFYITTDIQDPSAAVPLETMHQLGVALRKAAGKAAG